jgi:hypothetical protein
MLPAMSFYRFTIHNSHWFDNPDGTQLPDDAAAREMALWVIRDKRTT